MSSSSTAFALRKLTGCCVTTASGDAGAEASMGSWRLGGSWAAVLATGILAGFACCDNRFNRENVDEMGCDPGLAIGESCWWDKGGRRQRGRPPRAFSGRLFQTASPPGIASWLVPFGPEAPVGGLLRDLHLGILALGVLARQGDIRDPNPCRSLNMKLFPLQVCMPLGS